MQEVAHPAIAGLCCALTAGADCAAPQDRLCILQLTVSPFVDMTILTSFDPKELQPGGKDPVRHACLSTGKQARCN